MAPLSVRKASRLTACDALLFDLDGVLIDSIGLYRAAWRKWTDALGVNEAEVWADAHGRRPIDIISRIRGEAQLSSDLELFLNYLTSEAATSVTAIPGASELLTSLPRDAWAIVSSAPQACVETCLHVAGLPRPPVLISGEAVTNGKPHPECYQLAARQLGAAPGACVVVEDAPVGLAAARSAGMMAVAVASTHSEEDLAAADFTFGTLNKAVPWLLEAFS